MKKGLLTNITHAGTAGVQDAALHNRIRFINLVAIYPLFIYLFTSVYCIVFNFPRIVYTNLFGFVATSLVIYFNYRKQYSLAKSLLIASTAIILLIYYKLMMDEPGVFLFFGPILLMFITFYNPAEEKKYLATSILIVSCCFFGALFIPNAYFSPFPLSPALHRFIFVCSSIMNMLLTALYLFHNFRVNIRNEAVLKKANEDAVEGSRTKAIFLSNMSHELRTPLNGIIGTTDILQSEDYLPQQQHHLEVLKNLSDHMLGLVNNILDYSKIESGKIELSQHRFNMRDMLQKLEIIFRNQFKDKGLAFKVEIDPRLHTLDIYSDELRLQQVMINLVSNALKFTTTGEVKVTASVLNYDTEQVKIFMSVADTGIGIAPEVQQKIFESFSQGDDATTRRYGGTGLGLSISTSLVKRMSGTLHVNSTPGRGSDFHFDVTLPRYQNQEQKPDEKNFLSVEQLKNLKVLIAEDNTVNMVVAKRVLQKWEVQVTEAVNGRIALELCRQQTFDVLLIDLEMPEMDGRTAVKEINKLNKGMPCIAFTAGVYENMQEELTAHGFTDYLLKPFKPEDLYRKIITAMQNHPVKKQVAETL
jgi:signal transduction histidine kinase/CheY-like chemotaxis protein